MHYWVIRIAMLALVMQGAAYGATKQEERLAESAKVLQEIMDTPDTAIPDELIARSACIAILPGVRKAAFGFGGRHGAGYVVCRSNHERNALIRMVSKRRSLDAFTLAVCMRAGSIRALSPKSTGAWRSA